MELTVIPHTFFVFAVKYYKLTLSESTVVVGAGAIVVVDGARCGFVVVSSLLFVGFTVVIAAAG